MTIRKSVIFGALSLVLSNCAQSDKPGAPPSGIEQPPTASIEWPPELPAGTEKAVSAPLPRPKDKPIGFSVDPETLLNLASSEILQKMGPPAISREEPPAVIWSYLRGECRLDIYLYESLNTEILRSLTYIVESTRVDVPDKSYCLAKTN